MVAGVRALALAVLLPPSLAAAEAASAPPPLEQAIAEARDAGRPLLLEFSTVWCQPCQVLAERVLPDSEVQAALALVNFVQYDAEKGAGREAARRLGVDSYPTLVAVGADGSPGDRVVGLRPPPALAAWVREVAAKLVPSLAALKEAARRRPEDARLLLSLARRCLADGDRAEARRWLAAAERLAGGKSVASGGAPTTEAEAAGWERLRLDVDEGERALRGRLAREYLERYPGGRHAVEAAQLFAIAAPAATGDAAARALAERLLGKVVDASHDEGPRLGGLVLACLRAGARDAALRAATRAVERERSAVALAILAEARHQRGDNPEALALIDEAEAVASPQFRPLLGKQRERYRKGGGDPGDTLTMGDPLAAAAASRPSPPPAEQEAAEQRATTYRRLLERVSRACQPIAVGAALRRVWVRVALDEEGAPSSGSRRVKGVTVLEPSVPVLLQACIVGELTGASFAHPLGEDTFPILF